uniref:Uncharacterized protein n=1 Tax=Sphaerodactylus townsendi TaxID=933632 RepID=A0ACB8F4N7_9SAUR
MSAGKHPRPTGETSPPEENFSGETPSASKKLNEDITAETPPESDNNCNHFQAVNNIEEQSKELTLDSDKEITLDSDKDFKSLCNLVAITVDKMYNEIQKINLKVDTIINSMPYCLLPKGNLN